MNRRMKFRRRLSPPGYDAEHERGVLMAWTIISTVFAVLWFIGAYRYWYHALDRYSANTGSLLIQIADEVIQPAVRLYLVPELWSLVYIIYRFRYFYADSHCIYTIRRLSGENELWIRTLVLPVLESVRTVLIHLTMYGIQWWIFIVLAPEGTVPENVMHYIIRDTAYWWR